jgi:hypothetical protein
VLSLLLFSITVRIRFFPYTVWPPPNTAQLTRPVQTAASCRAHDELRVSIASRVRNHDVERQRRVRVRGLMRRSACRTPHSCLPVLYLLGLIFRVWHVLEALGLSSSSSFRSVVLAQSNEQGALARNSALLPCLSFPPPRRGAPLIIRRVCNRTTIYIVIAHFLVDPIGLECRHNGVKVNAPAASSDLANLIFVRTLISQVLP